MAPPLFGEFFFALPYLLILVSLGTSLLVFPLYGFSYRTAGFPLIFQISCYFVATLLLLLVTFWPTFGSSIQFFGLLHCTTLQLPYLLLILFTGFLSFFFYLSLNTVSFSYETAIFIFIVIGASLLLLTSSDLLLSYLSIELQSLALYVLAGSKTNSTFSTEASLKYFVLGSFASSVLLFGISLFYALLGTVNFSDSLLLLDLAPSSLQVGYYTACILIFTGLLFKVGVAPFHFWVADVYSGSPLSIFSFFALLPKIAVWGLLVKFVAYCNASFDSTLTDTFLALSLISLVVGAYGGVVQVSLKRMLAYSAIAQSGYLLLPFSFFSAFTASSNFFYLLTYALSLAPMLLILFGFTGRGVHPFVFDSIFSLKFLYRYSSLLAVFFLISVFSLAGIPPFSGFFSKIYLFAAAIWEGYYYFTLFSLILSAASTVYYLRLVRIASLLKTFQSWLFLQEVSRPFAYFISFFTFVNGFFLLIGGDLLSLLNFFCLIGFF